MGDAPAVSAAAAPSPSPAKNAVVAAKASTSGAVEASGADGAGSSEGRVHVFSFDPGLQHPTHLVLRPRRGGQHRRRRLPPFTLTLRLPPPPPPSVLAPPSPSAQPVESSETPAEQPLSSPLASASERDQHQAATPLTSTHSGEGPSSRDQYGSEPYLEDLVALAVELARSKAAERATQPEAMPPAVTPGPATVSLRCPQSGRAFQHTPLLPRYTPMEGVPERWLPGSVLAGGAQLLAGGLQAPGSCIVGYDTPIEGVPERPMKRLCLATPAPPMRLSAHLGPNPLRNAAAAVPSEAATAEAAGPGPAAEVGVPLGPSPSLQAQGGTPHGAAGCLGDEALGAGFHDVLTAGGDMTLNLTAADIAAQVAATAEAAMQRIRKLEAEHPVSVTSTGTGNTAATPSCAAIAPREAASVPPSASSTPVPLKMQNLAAAAANAVLRAAEAMGGPPTAHRLSLAPRASLPPRAPRADAGLSGPAEAPQGGMGASRSGSDFSDEVAGGLEPGPSGLDSRRGSLDGLIHRVPSGALLFPSRTPSPLGGLARVIQNGPAGALVRAALLIGARVPAMGLPHTIAYTCSSSCRFACYCSAHVGVGLGKAAEKGAEPEPLGLTPPHEPLPVLAGAGGAGPSAVAVQAQPAGMGAVAGARHRSSAAAASALPGVTAEEPRGSRAGAAAGCSAVGAAAAAGARTPVNGPASSADSGRCQGTDVHGGVRGIGGRCSGQGVENGGRGTEARSAACGMSAEEEGEAAFAHEDDAGMAMVEVMALPDEPQVLQPRGQEAKGGSRSQGSGASSDADSKREGENSAGRHNGETYLHERKLVQGRKSLAGRGLSGEEIPLSQYRAGTRSTACGSASP